MTKKSRGGAKGENRESIGTDFDRWLTQSFSRWGPFTALVVLVRIAEPKIEPLASTYLHVIGDETDWADISLMFAGARVSWDGAAFFPTQDESGGPTPDAVARTRLRELEAKLREDRMVLNEGEFFDVWGRSLKIEVIGRATRLHS
jgi:hypothetical protein